MLNMPEMARPGASFWLMPSQVEAETTCEYLGERGIALREPHTATAPTYPETGTIEDATLLNQLEELKPKFVILNIAGGKQEKLGYYLRQNLSYKPAIICTGAAIAFLTGHQARIPMWADRLFLGWLWRCCEKPGIYIPRYLSAVRLAYLVFRYGEELPPLKTAN
jgi:N-acetylglucosaminyldiphosphoundecaprenol N-acetyl-beta-D-mannosaminyltransferase